ncbi:MAG TPA: cyclic peptide export ABC transporter [Candidatus Kapabacteria bacterium]|nr:cyclic peptide export ABC transporter [Candidatus Kapabacteria bacterium]
MNFLRFLLRESTTPLYKILIMSGLAGIANAVLLAIINNAVKKSSFNHLNFQNLLMFSCTITIYIVSQKYILHKSTEVIEGIIAQIRVRLAGKIRRAHLLDLENIGQAEIYNRLTQETLVISNSAPILVLTIQWVIMLFFVSIYIAILSKIALFLIITLLTAAIFYYLQSHKKQQLELAETNKTEMAFFDSLTAILKGIKEIKLNHKRDSDLFRFLEGIAGKLKVLKTHTTIKYFNNSIFAHTFYYFLIGVVLFILPRLYPTYTNVLIQLIAAILFTVGPINNIVGAIQTFDQVDFAVATIYRLEDELSKIIEIDREHPGYDNRLEAVKSFAKIRLDNLEFSYKDHNENNNFSIGPFSFDIRAGETLFIVGGNGSGKTTLLKVLCMLYYPGKGSIYLDDVKIESANAVDYRELFAAVFADFHLFPRLYGMEGVKQEKVFELLKIMGIEHKTKFLADRFSTTDLSTGQRKRLALLVSLLEDKPVYIFDEWAADQDPEFRHYFYEVILKNLKEAGKTIIAASHDDRFFHFADRVIKLDYGKIVEESKNNLQ